MPARPHLALALVMLLSCGGDPAPSGKGMVVSGGPGTEEKAVDAQGKQAPPAHVENTGDFDRFAFTCCQEPAATALVQAYVDLVEKLAADDAAGSQAALEALHGAAVAAASADGLDQAGRQQAQALATGLEPLKGKDLTALREPLASLSVSVVAFARAHQGGQDKLVAAYCPMAPGHWLQRSHPIRNPYYGAEMLTCGTLEAVTDVE